MTKSTESIPAVTQAATSLPKPSAIALQPDAKPFQPSSTLSSCFPTSTADMVSTTQTELLVQQQQRLAVQSHLINQQQQQLQQLITNQTQQQQLQHNMVLRSALARSTASSGILTAAAQPTVMSTTMSRTVETQATTMSVGLLQHSSSSNEDCCNSTVNVAGRPYSLRRDSSLPIPCATPPKATSSRYSTVDDDFIMGYAETSDYGSCSDGSGTPTGTDDVFHRTDFFGSNKENDDSGNHMMLRKSFARTPGAGRKTNVGPKFRLRSSPIFSPRNNLMLPEGKLPGWSPLDGGKFCVLFCF